MNQPLAEAIFWIAAIACIIGELMILRSSFAVKRESKSDLVPTASRGGELAWAIIPALGLCVLLLVTWRRVDARGQHLRMMDHSTMDPSMQMPQSTR